MNLYNPTKNVRIQTIFSQSSVFDDELRLGTMVGSHLNGPSDLPETFKQIVQCVSRLDAGQLSHISCTHNKNVFVFLIIIQEAVE